MDHTPKENPPARLLYAVSTLASCGTTDLVRQLVRRVDRSRFRPEVMALRARDPAAPRDGESDAEVAGAARFLDLDVPTRTLLLEPRFGFWRRLAPLVEHLRSASTAIVHAHSRPADLWATWAGVRAGTPVRVYSRQATYGGMPLATRGRYAVTARAASRVVAVSEAVRRHLRLREGVGHARIELIHDGIDLDRLADVAAAEDTRQRLGIPCGVPLVGCVADLTARKGQRHLVEAAPRIWRRVPEAHFALVGDGPERADLAARVAASGRPQAFHFLGWREDVADCIAAFDVFVLPSLWEGLNLSLLTAAALARPVVATHLMANREVLEPGVSGLFPTPLEPALDVTRLDPGLLADAVSGLLRNPARRASLGLAAQRRVRARFGDRAMAARHEALYGRLLGGRAAQDEDPAAGSAV